MKKNFYPRPPCGGRPEKLLQDLLCRWISIHALRAEGDSQTTAAVRPVHAFLSTPSVRRATWRKMVPSGLLEISIHALRAEGDAASVA